MSDRDKIIQRVLSRPNNLRFEEIEKFLKICGYRLDRIHGSHYIFIRRGFPTLTIHHKSPLKRYLIAQVIQATENILEQLLDE
ncbi:MAG: type II toxin-antitoxin system HicA family toxin [Chloroflexota bacterium]